METQRLVCAATWMELRTFDDGIEASVEHLGFGRHEGTVYLLTGVGIPCTLARVLQVGAREKPKVIVNLGIAGAYPDTSLSVGDLVMGESEVYGDLGFELPDRPGFQPLREAPFGAEYRAALPLLQAQEYGGIKTGHGCTVNTCTGTDQTGRLRAQLFAAAFETMEGAAVAQAGQALGIPVCEIRAISNIAARRDMQPANIRLALAQLTAYFQTRREAHDARTQPWHFPMPK